VTTCDSCGFVYEDVAVGAVAGIVRGFGPRYREVLLDTAGPEGTRDERAARTRPSPTTWSALEYACHVRDVLLVQRDRAVAALVHVRPSFPPMHRDERVELAHYDSQGLETVADQIEMAADLFALVFDDLNQEQLRRSLVYNFPEPTERDLAWLGRHTVHEGEHHLVDIRSVLSGVEPSG
jgi:hypothetical protein